ncbi:cytochrome P450 [Artomyces pyxidatus]|uniref:Cytochrome P450 n=1 Tax=Artomyces pyxidatus TaxID=48021 RepID=A0ACB8SWI8_9AGAM|nr:cytochrome P450 [Artomyces pyxidatus]
MVIFFAICALLCAFVILGLISYRLRAPLPPGPTGLPILGNLLDMPTSQEWKVFAEWGERWGGIVSVNLLGQTIIIINSFKSAMDLLDGKSSIYSDRPVLVMGGEMVGWKNSLALMRYGGRFRSYRRMMHQFMGTRSLVERYHPIEELETHRLLRRLLRKPEDFAEHIRHTTGAIILQLAYGYKIQEQDDPFVTNADTATDQFSRTTAPGAFLVDVFPLLRFVPEWIPGAGWKRTAARWAAGTKKMCDEPFEWAKRRKAQGDSSSSFIDAHLKDNLSIQEIVNVKWAAASLYAAGADTTVSALQSFFLTMVLHPEIQKKAQQELDAVVGSERLPSFSDRDNLPYINALVKEVLRWNPVAPTGLAHRVMKDDIYDGYFIPRGSFVLVNIWKLLHDEDTYKDPMAFNPARFLASDSKSVERDPHTISFGFGRRICPGVHLADASLFIACAMTLAVFDISKTVENGAVVEPVNDYTSGTLSHPKPFKCSIKPRSERAITLIRAVDSFDK